MMKPIGTASHPIEETIEGVIRDAALFRGGRGMVYGPVSGGISNENWRVTRVRLVRQGAPRRAHLFRVLTHPACAWDCRVDWVRTTPKE